MTPPSDIYRRIISAKLFIDQNFHESIDLEEISGKAFLSPYHFHRLFTRIYGNTPHRYLTRKRMDKAQELLAGDRLTIGEVCAEVGFESLGSFSVLFKKEIGFTPSFYRNKALQKKQEAKKQPKSQIPGCFIDRFGLDRPANPGMSSTQ